VPTHVTFTTLITGASSGIGAEIARQSAALGHDLALCARRTDRLDALAAEITASFPTVTVRTYALDVTDADAVRRVFRTADTDAGRLDRVVVNAGLGKGRKIGSGFPEANRETAVTNVLGALAQAEAATEIFREQGRGHLVLVSSVSAVRGNRGAVTTYGATKAFVANLGEGLQSEFLRSRLPVDVTVVLPGFIESEMTAGITGGASAGDSPAGGRRPPFMVSTQTGVRAIMTAVEKRRRRAFVPALPWRGVALLLRVAPLWLVSRLT
jgi:short-subunit dehydrogenase